MRKGGDNEVRDRAIVQCQGQSCPWWLLRSCSGPATLRTHILIFITIWLSRYKWGKQFKCLRELCRCFSVDWTQKLGYQPNPGLRVKIFALYPEDEDKCEPCLTCCPALSGGDQKSYPLTLQKSSWSQLCIAHWRDGNSCESTLQQTCLASTH